VDGAGAATVIGNLSLGGMFIKTDAEFDLGARICVTLEDPRNRARVQLGCVVRRQVFGAQRGIGVEFENMSAASRAALKEIVGAATPADPVKASCELLVLRARPERKVTLPGLFAVRDDAPLSGRSASPSPRAFA
jgi:Tfp pilus assembly protein PilZ